MASVPENLHASVVEASEVEEEIPEGFDPEGFEKPFNGFHRGKQFDLCSEYLSAVIGGIEVIAIRMAATKKYWVVADQPAHDDRFTDIGPFDTPEEALLVLKLHS